MVRCECYFKVDLSASAGGGAGRGCDAARGEGGREDLRSGRLAPAELHHLEGHDPGLGIESLPPTVAMSYKTLGFHNDRGIGRGPAMGRITHLRRFGAAPRFAIRDANREAR